MSNYDVDSLKQVLEAAKKVAIFLPGKLETDHLAAGLGLFLSFKKMSKRTQLFTPAILTVEHNKLIGIEQIQNQLVGENLVIKFDYRSDYVDHVFTNVNQENGNLELLIQPVLGKPLPDHQRVGFEVGKFEADLVFGVGIKHMEDLDYFADEVKAWLPKATLVLVSDQELPANYVGLKVMDLEAVSLSEVVFNLLNDLVCPLDEDIVTNIMAGIEQKTDFLSDLVTTPRVLETAAACLRLGAVRKYIEVSSGPSGITNKPGASSFQESAFVEEAVQPEKSVAPEVEEFVSEISQIVNEQDVTEIEEDSVKIAAGNGAAKKVDLPTWMMPKIFS